MVDIFVSNPIEPKEEIKPEKKAEIPVTESQKSRYLGHNHFPLTSFNLYPENINFETQENDEKIILLLRMHPITNLKWILISLLMILVPSIVGILGLFDSFPLGFSVVMTLGWYLITSAYMLESFLTWYFNVYFVTDRRIIDVDFHNLIYKQVSDAQLNKIQDLTYNMGGVVRTFFNYGNVFIQTAGEVNEFEFLAVPYPDKVAKVIQDLLTP